MLLEGSLPLVGTWVGQDLHDYVGPAFVAAPSGVQDVHIRVSGVPAGRTIRSAQISGLGGGQWAYNMPSSAGWAAAFQADGQGTAELYFEPYQVETGRPFNVALRYDDGSSSDLWLTGGAADPGARMPAASLQVEWVGQDGTDVVGTGPAVGPDGIQDVRLRLTNLSSDVAIASVDVRGPDGLEWRSGVNSTARADARFMRDTTDPTRGELLIGTDRNLAGASLTVEVVYATSFIDQETVTAGVVDPSLGLPVPATPTIVSGVSAVWLGQDGRNLGGQLGSVHLTVSGLPADRRIVAAVVTGGASTSWVYRTTEGQSVYTDDWARPLSLVRSDATTADLGFVPIRDESGATITVRLVFDDGSEALAETLGAAVDFNLRAPGPESSSIVAQPGDDLQALVRQYGTVYLAPGVFVLSEPLVLDRAIALIGQSGAELRFRQDATAPAWATAIEVRAAQTTLDGFSIRFDGPVRWDWSTPYGAAVIGSIDNRKAQPAGPLYDLAFTGLDIESPAVASPGTWEEAPRLFRLESAQDGRIEGNVLIGGMTVIRGGPWRFAGNDYRGTAAFTTADAVISGLDTHDVEIDDNHAEPAPGAGKTWRFAVLTQSGTGDRIAGNESIHIGPRDDDPIPNPNAPEQILTEAYRLRFEGRPQAITQEGRLVQIPTPQGDAVRVGDVLAVLSGPNAGQWRRVVQVIDGRTFWVDAPLPDGTANEAISVGPAFTGLTVADNRIDTTGSSIAANVNLVGAQFGTQVIGNTVLGGNNGLLIAASSTEVPVAWGWSHTPLFDLVVEGNTVEGARNGSLIQVDHGPYTKASKGRTYLTGLITRNAFGALLLSGSGPVGPALTIGTTGTIDPDELRVVFTHNVALSAGTRALAVAGRINNEVLVGVNLGLEPATLDAPTNLRLREDTGTSATDGLTSNPLLGFTGTADANHFEYRVGSTGAYRPLVSAADFLPEGLADGTVTVWVRAVGWTGFGGNAASLTFVLDRNAPVATAPGLDASTDSGASASDGLTSSRQPVFQVKAEAGASVELLRDGVVVARRTGAGTLLDPTAPGDGSYRYTVRLTDAAGNVGTSDPAVVTIDTTAPVAVSGLAAQGRTIRFGRTGPTDRYEASVDGGAFVAIADPGGWTSEALTSGAVHTVAVRAIDPAGNVGPEAWLSVDLLAPTTAAPRLEGSTDSGASATDGITSSRQPAFRVEAEADTTVQLVRDGVVVARRTGPGLLLDPTSPGDGTYAYRVVRTDPADNISTSDPAVVTIDTTLPDAVSGLAAQGRTIRFRPSSAADRFEASVDGGAFVAIADPSGWTSDGLTTGAVHTVIVRAIDPAGNVGPGAVVTVDLLPPTTAAPRLDASTDSGVSATDGLTSRRDPMFVVEAEPDSTVALQRDGLTVAWRMGPGLMTDPSSPWDGRYIYRLIRTDAAGNTSTSDPTIVTIDTTAPGSVVALSAAGATVWFGPTSPTDRYEASVDGGPFVAVPDPSAWTSPALSPGPHSVTVRAIDEAGNVGAGRSFALLVPPLDPLVMWLGQDGTDVASLGTARRDGYQDVHLRLDGLTLDRVVTAVIVTDASGGQWSAGPWTGNWDAVFVRRPGASQADLYVQPYRSSPSGEIYRVQLRYDDGSTSTVSVVGGAVDAARRSRVVSAPALRNVLVNGRAPTTIRKTSLVPGSGLTVALQTWKRQQQFLAQLRRGRKQ
jgi:hypothetical protein